MNRKIVIDWTFCINRCETLCVPITLNITLIIIYLKTYTYVIINLYTLTNY